MLRLKSKHYLMCGDSTDRADVDRLMDGQKADMVFTDPPYGIAFKNHQDKTSNKGWGTRKVHQYEIIQGDSTDFDPAFILDFFDNVKEIFIWGANNFTDHLPKSSWVCWDRKLTEEMDRQLNGDFDLCWSKAKHKMVMVRITWSGVCGHSKKDDGNTRIHPTQKPVKLAEEFFLRWGKDKLNIVDLFLGSGSTLIACEKTNRQCYGMEIDPHYCSVIIKRYEDYSGKKAIHA